MATPTALPQTGKRMRFVYEPMHKSKTAWPEEIRRAAAAYVTEQETQERALQAHASKRRWMNVRPSSPRMKRKYQIFEGNFHNAFAHIGGFLERHDLQELLTHGRCSSNIVGDPIVEFEENDVWAVNYIVQFISADFLERWCIEKPVTTANLYKILKGACSPFRFMDLPQSLRKRVLGHLVPTGNEYEEFHHKTYPVRRPCLVEALCAVSDEFKEEVLTIYYGENDFEIEPAMGIGPEVLQQWAAMVGEQHLQHLRSLKATFSFYKGCFDGIHVTYSSTKGLKCEVQEVVDFDYDTWERRGDQHVALIEERKRTESWTSTGVIEFFTLDPDAVRRIVYGPLVMAEDEDEIVDERDAYQMAYGRPMVYVDGCCPW